jgi:hypothetical protein
MIRARRDDQSPIPRECVLPDCSEHELKEVHDLLKRLRRSSMRKTIQAVLRGEALSPEAMSSLFHVLQDQDDRKWQERILAAWALRHLQLHPGLKEKAADILQAIIATPHEFDAQRTNHIVTWVFKVLGVITAVEFIGLLLSTPRLPDDFLFLPFGLVILFLITIVSGFLPVLLLTIPIYQAVNATRHNLVRAVAATSLGKLGLRQSVPTVVAAACGREQRTVGAGPVRKAALATLPSLLATLTTEDYGQFGSQVVPDLCRLLRQSSDDIVLSALEALGKIGDGQAVDPVERLARDTKEKGLLLVQEAAERILPVLRQRQQEENNPRVLLRAAYAPAAPADTLLRPAQGVPEAEPQVLLRPSAQEES